MKIFHKKFVENNQKHSLYKVYDSILIGVSGGMDSMALLHILKTMREITPLTLAICHVHHGLRGKSADLDEIFVRNTASRSGIPFYGTRVDAVKYTKAHGLSPEEGARDLRHSVLEEVRERIGFDCIALAHQADDQAETILMNMARGSGIRGLGGIRPKRDRIIHPLLFASREEILSYTNRCHLSFRDDPTNRNKKFRRNQIRSEILTPLKAIYGSSLIHTIGRSGEHAQEILTFLEQEESKAWASVVREESNTEIVLDIYQFLRYFTSVQKALIEQAIQQLCPDFYNVSNTLFNRLVSLVQSRQSGRWIRINEIVRAAIHNNHLVFYKVLSPIQNQKVWPDSQFDIKEIDKVLILNKLEPGSLYSLKKKESQTEYIDFDKIQKPLHVRSFRPGDWFVPLGMEGKKKLKDYFIDAKIPAYKRQSIPLLVQDRDIICILGYRLDERFKVKSQTRNILKIKLTG
ncbi:tRNA lysidine(34) synthetase TilS [candidate division KSB1 bacterium]|nr:tRNA lysidine(34) synthetase TilS [candidate division KSB1 bacterium]